MTRKETSQRQAHQFDASGRTYTVTEHLVDGAKLFSVDSVGDNGPWANRAPMAKDDLIKSLAKEITKPGYRESIDWLNTNA